MAEENAKNETVESEIDKETESVMNDLSKKDKKETSKEAKQLASENSALTAKLKEATEALEKAKAELADTNDKYLRVCAEYDNFRKRSAKERDGLYTDAYSDALKEVLPVIDNLERASQYTEPEKVADGLALIFKSASEMLNKLGVETFGEAGEKFDPNIHNAVMHVEDEEKGENEITDVFQKGYKKGDRIIRHAMVKVAN